jgi:ketosteroid isomerase-like protein
MSEENVERVQRFWELYNRRETDAWVAMLAPDVEWHVDPQDPDTTIHRGPEAVKRYGQNWAETMNATIEVREVFEAADQVVTWTRIEMRGEASGVPAGQDEAFIFKLRDRLITRVRETRDKKQALEAAGLSE